MNVVVTMAGAGSRFLDAGYKEPKYRITVRGRSLFHWSVSSLLSFARSGYRFIFVAQRAHGAIDFISRECAELHIRNFDLIEVDGLTNGQATTALSAADAVSDAGMPFAIYNIDTYVEPHALAAQGVCGAGWIPCFEATGSAWSFVRPGPGSRVLEVKEKAPISPYATIGLYWFESLHLYKLAYETCYGPGAEGTLTSERYVAPMYNAIIAAGHEVYFMAVPGAAVHPLGTPSEVKAFGSLAAQPFSKRMKGCDGR